MGASAREQSNFAPRCFGMIERGWMSKSKSRMPILKVDEGRRKVVGLEVEEFVSRTQARQNYD